jgi:ABC-type oligopeptide transport system ATPase subunit
MDSAFQNTAPATATQSKPDIEPPIISVRDLSVHFPMGRSVFGKRSYLTAVDNVSFDIPRGSFFGLVGESGSGKSTTGRSMLQINDISAGEIIYNDGEMRHDIGAIKGAALKDFRARTQMIFQDPYAALSPRMTVRDIIAEPLESLRLTGSRAETNERVREIAQMCRLDPEHLRRFPHAFSGGQRQRIAIARALVSRPKFVIADEAVAALDVSIQAEILELLKTLQHELNLTILFISHDLAVVANLCDHTAVMQKGQIVEAAPTAEVFRNPKQEYTRALLAAAPVLKAG